VYVLEREVEATLFGSRWEQVKVTDDWDEAYGELMYLRDITADKLRVRGD